jgi:hypothetical protein
MGAVFPLVFDVCVQTWRRDRSVHARRSRVEGRFGRSWTSAFAPILITALMAYRTRLILFAALSVCVLYAGDYLLLRYRIAANREPFGRVKTQAYYAVPQKNKKTEFYFQDPQMQNCVHSLFPHMGDSPCWYLSRHTQQRINM